MAGYYGDPNMNGLLAALVKPTRRKVFVSYHHGGDQAYYDEFSRFFHDQYEAIRDNSLERLIQSDDTEYVMRKIREQYITGTSCTVVLIGAQSHERKYLDWESDYRFWWENTSDKTLPPFERQKAYPKLKDMISQWSDVRAIMRAIQDELVTMYKLVDVTKLA